MAEEVKESSHQPKYLFKSDFIMPPPNPPKKLPYDFWKEIGSPKTVVAPMVDNSDLAYRMQTRKYGADLTYTQMLNCTIFSNSKDNRKNLFSTCPEDRPLFAQLAGHDPEQMLASARYVEKYCDAVDINLGCPQTIAKRGRYGSFLMEELEVLDKIVRTLVKGLSIPVTCKSRIYHDFDTTIRLYETLVNAGASVITVHGRTRDEKGYFVGAADWDMIARVKKHFSERPVPIPVIANGGIGSMDDVMRCLAYTKCDAVMVSEAVLENPALFSRNLDPHGNYRTLVDLADEYLDYVEKYPVYHVKCVRSHILKMCYRFIISDRELRNQFANSTCIEEFRACIAVLKQKIIDENIDEDSLVSWYNRHRVGNESVSFKEEGEGCNDNECTPTPSAKIGGCHVFPELNEELLSGLSIFDTTE